MTSPAESSRSRPAPAESSPDLAVSAHDLTVRHARSRHESVPAVNGVTLELRHGDILAIIGETGSGKSTLASAIAGAASATVTGGSLTVLGMSARNLTARRRERFASRVGYVPQDAGGTLQSHLTVGENVAEPIFSRDRHFNERVASVAVATLMDTVRLPLAAMNLFPHELSGGQRQRVAIARALILEPELLVADDPTAGIDVAARGAILDILREIQSQRRFSAFVVTHTIGEVRHFSDRVAIMHRGVIVGSGSVEEVLDSPQHEYVEGLARVIRDLKNAEELSAL